MSFELAFEIEPELYRRAAATPIDGPVSKRKTMLRNIAAATLFPASILAFNRALFAPEALLAMCFAAVLGAGVVLLAWRWQQMKLISIYGRYNETGGAQTMQIGPDGLFAARPNVSSQVEWAFVRELRGIEGASLIELPTARLIVPNTALPQGMTQAAFLAQLQAWRAA